MTKISRTGIPWFRSDNLKSKIENWRGLVAFGVEMWLNGSWSLFYAV